MAVDTVLIEWVFGHTVLEEFGELLGLRVLARGNKGDMVARRQDLV